MFVVRLDQPLLVLGGSQSVDVLDVASVGTLSIRRRRGGGGLVLLQPDDLWIDWWIPASDQRWSGDVRVSSLSAGRWWADALGGLVDGVISVHEGSLVGEPAHRVVCFAGRGPGEVFVNDRKAVGLTQWRVREGVFLSTVLARHRSEPIVDLLAAAPAGLTEALDHHDMASLGMDDPEAIVSRLETAGGSWHVRQLFLTT